MSPWNKSKYEYFNEHLILERKSIGSNGVDARHSTHWPPPRVTSFGHEFCTHIWGALKRKWCSRPPQMHVWGVVCGVCSACEPMRVLSASTAQHIRFHFSFLFSFDWIEYLSSQNGKTNIRVRFIAEAHTATSTRYVFCARYHFDVDSVFGIQDYHSRKRAAVPYVCLMNKWSIKVRSQSFNWVS